ncbi:MAG: hypothetical protein PF569_05540 [Candidatus Woesearchaeota archaeon]|jgi:hypothetical protein|nr:hypothetical protein [Candidatus Woesearchaeota archaeon]
MFQIDKIIVGRKPKHDFKNILSEVELLANILNMSQIPWQLVGGLGTALNYGSLYRNHHDIDIEVDIKQLPELTKYMKKQNYELCLGLPTRGRRFLPFKSYCKISPEQCNLGRHSLYLVNPNSKYSYLKAIDLMTKDTQDEITTWELLHSKIQYDGNLKGKIVKIGSQNVELRNPIVHKLILEETRKKLKNNNMERILLDCSY